MSRSLWLILAGMMLAGQVWAAPAVQVEMGPAVNLGEEAQKIKSEAEKDREIILAEAYRESEELRGGGDAKAFRIYADAYRQDPHFFEFTRTMEAYRKTLKDKTTILVSPESEFFRYLKQR